MTKSLWKLVMCVGLEAVVSVGSAFADQIGGPGFVPENLGGGGWWVGTYQGTPGYADGNDSFTIAQLIPSNYEYTNLVLQIQMHGDSVQSTMDFSLAPDQAGLPGTAIATQSATLTSGLLKTYTVPFQNATLLAGRWYWLVASSRDTEPWSGPYGLPVIVASPGYDFPMAYSQNGGPWTSPGYSLAYELDGVRVSQDFVSAGPSPTFTTHSVPEPSSLVLLFFGGLMTFAWTLFNRR